MTPGTLTLACLLLAPAALPEVWPMNQRGFQVPIRIDAKRRGDLQELILYTSTNQGQTWEMRQKTTPDKDSFDFYATGDGMYWLIVQEIDRQGNRVPLNLMEAPVGARILVDTVKPELSVSAERPGEDVVVRWEMRDDNPDPASLKLEYRSADPQAVWNPVPLSASPASPLSFRPGVPGTVWVRAQVQDQAGNTTAVEKEVKAAIAGSGTPAGPTTPAAWSGPTLTAGSSLPKPPALTTGNPPRYASGVDSPFPVAVPSPGGAAGPNSGTQVVASSQDSALPVPAAPAVSRAPAGPMPPMQMVNSRVVTLDYEVAKFGPSGVGSVELYVSREENGRWSPWQLYPVAGDAAAPPSPEGPKGAGSVRRSLTVELPGEGVYGFYLVVKSGAGLGKPAPQNGIPPQMRLEVDLTAPVAKLIYPEPEPGRRDALVLLWSATDRNLTANPVTLEWAERRDGRWEAIGADLANSGRHAWKLPPNVPASVYLRLTVRDTAGNVAVAETPQPILVDLNEPEVKFLGLGGTSR